MPKYKVTYFDVAGLGEPVRRLLAYMKADFEDFRFQRENWPAIKTGSPFGKVPTLEFDGHVYSDSVALSRYLGSEAGLGGKTALENLRIDQVMGALGDLIGEVVRMYKTEDDATKEKLKDTLIKTTVPFYMSKFDEIIKKDGYLANGKFSWVDIYAVTYIEFFSTMFKANVMDKYPHFKALKEKVESLPGISDWIKKSKSS